MTENSIISRISKFLRKDNNMQLAIAGVAAVALIVFVLTTLSGPGNKPADSNSSGNSQADTAVSADLETRLEQILSEVEGAGAVKVMVNYETGPEIVPAVKTDTQNNSSDGTGSTDQHTTSITENQEPVVVQGENGTEPMVLVKKEPVVLGVLVVAEGASEMAVRLRLMHAVQVALQIAPAQIEVLPKNITNNEEGN